MYREMKKLNLTPIEDLAEEDFGKGDIPSILEYEIICDDFIHKQCLKSIPGQPKCIVKGIRPRLSKIISFELL